MKTWDEVQREYRQASLRFKEAERELKAVTARETKALEPLLGQQIVDARFYEEGEGSYVLTTATGTVVTFSASGDDATYVSCEVVTL